MLLPALTAISVTRSPTYALLGALSGFTAALSTVVPASKLVLMAITLSI